MTYGDMASMCLHFGLEIKAQTLTARVNAGKFMDETESAAFINFLKNPPVEWKQYADDIELMFKSVSGVYIRKQLDELSDLDDITFDDYEVPTSRNQMIIDDHAKTLPVHEAISSTMTEELDEFDFLMDQPLEESELTAELTEDGLANDSDEDDLFDLGVATESDFEIEDPQDPLGDDTVDPDEFDFDAFING